MADEDKGTEEETTEEETEETEDTGSEDDDSGDGDDEKEEKDPELVKAIRRRDRALAENRRLKKQIEEASKEKEEKDDPVAKANARLIASSTRTVLASNGITDKDDQKAILGVLNLSDIDVDDDGPDEDAIEERIDELKRIFGGTESRTTRVPRTVKTNRSTKETTSDPDKSRYDRILGRR